MKKFIVIVAICLLAITTWNFWASLRMFPSRGLENAIRVQIDKPEGVITSEDCRGITELNLSASDWNTSLEGLQYFVDLEILVCNAGMVSDISALSELTQLKELTLRLNKISDLTPLAGLTNLEILDLSDNRVSDLSPLASLTNLKRLIIGKNPVGLRYDGFTPLSHLDGLRIGALADYEIIVGEDELVSPYARY